MNRLRVSELVLGFLLGFTSLLIIFLLSSDFALHELVSALDAHNGIITAIATGFIAWFTLSLRQSTDKLWNAGERQIEIARQTALTAERALTVVERAFIAISEMRITTISQYYDTIIVYRMDVFVVNSGRTPARNYICKSNLAVFDGEIPKDFRFPDRSHDDLFETGTTIGPQSRTHFRIDLFIQDAIDVYEGRKNALVYGWLEYDDIFPDSPRHRTEFCLSIGVYADPRQTPQVISGTAPPILTIVSYRSYNGYDEGCLYRPGQTPVAEDGELPPLTQPPVVQPPPPASAQPAQSFPTMSAQFRYGASNP